VPGQDRIERMLHQVWQRCRVRFEQELRPFEIALGECLNALFKDSTNWPEQWAAFVAQWQARGVLISEQSQQAIEELLSLVARKQPIPHDPSGRYFAPTKLAQSTAPPPSNATSPNWPALTEGQREHIRNESGLPWWYPVPAKAPGDSGWEKILEVKGRQARDKLLAFFQSLEAFGAQTEQDQGDSDDGLDALASHVRGVRDAYDAYIASYVSLLQYSLHYMETQLFLGIFVAGLMQKLDLTLPPSLFGMHSKYERELMEVQAALTKASNSVRGRVDVTYTVAVWADRVITAIEAATFVVAAATVVRTAIVKAIAEGASRSAALNLAIKAGIKQAAIQVARELAITTVLPEVLIAAGLDEEQVRKGLLLLDAVPQLMNLRTIRLNPGPRTAKSQRGLEPVQSPTANVEPVPIVGRFPRSNVAGRFWTKTIEFQGVTVYQRTDLINPNLTDKYGRTNLVRMRQGLAPLGPDGASMNLHHMLQTQDGPIAEVTETFHQQNSSIVHVNPKTIPSGISRSPFDTWRRQYWMNRARDFGGDKP